MAFSPTTAARMAVGVIAFMNAAFGLRFTALFFFAAAFFAVLRAGASFAGFFAFFAADFFGAFFAFFVAMCLYLHSSRIAAVRVSRAAAPFGSSAAATECRGVHAMSTVICHPCPEGEAQQTRRRAPATRATTRGRQRRHHGDLRSGRGFSAASLHYPARIGSACDRWTCPANVRAQGAAVS